MRKTWWIKTLLAMMVAAVLAGPVAAQNQPSPIAAAASAPSVPLTASRPDTKLSYRLQLLADSAQLRAARSDVKAQALSLPESGPGSLATDEQGRLLADVRVSAMTGANQQALVDAGADIVYVSAPYRVATVYVAAADLSRLAQLGFVENVQEESAPLTDGAGAGLGAASPRAAAATCPTGATVTEGDHQLRADTARSMFGVNGAGVKVGLLSDTYNRDAAAVTSAAQDVATGDLPGPGNPCGFLTAVNVISDTNAVGTDSGRVMAQIVHDLAPGATLGFATTSPSQLAFAGNIRQLRAWGADVIADGVHYLEEPIYQDGPISVAIADVVASGAVYVAPAGDGNNTIAGHNVTSYETLAYRPAPGPAALHEESCHNFNPTGGTVDTTYGLTLQNGGSVSMFLQWAQPWYGVTTDLDLYVMNAANTVVAKSQTNNTGLNGTQQPYEDVSWSNATGTTQNYFVYVCRFVSATANTQTPRFKIVLWLTVGLTAVEYPVSNGGDIVGPTAIGHSASLAALSVASAPYNNNNAPESFSSFGPATHYFGPVVGTTPAAAIGPLLIQKPDIAATDGGCNTFRTAFVAGCYRAFGALEAAAHAAGVAALLKQQANQIGLPLNNGLVALLLRSTARPMSGGVPASVGAGLIDALGAMQKEIGLVRLFVPLILR